MADNGSLVEQNADAGEYEPPAVTRLGHTYELTGQDDEDSLTVTTIKEP